MDPGISVQNKNLTENQEKLAEVPGANSLEFGIAYEYSPGIIARLHHTDRRLM